jgi:Helix-turn-helix domain
MNEPTLANSATPAKCALRRPPWFSSLTADELDAALNARIDAARCGPAPVRYEPSDDDDLVEGGAAVPTVTIRSSTRSRPERQQQTSSAMVPNTQADGLKTPAKAAQRLGVSIRTLRGLVSAGDLRYVNVGRGKQREKMMFTDSDLDDLIASRTRMKAQESCLSTSRRVRPSTNTISDTKVLDFTARRNGQIGAKRKS